MLPLFARTLVIGVLVAAPVGAMALLCIDRTLKRGWRAGLATGAGIATADACYAAVAAFGVTAVSTAVVEWQTPLRLVGGVALVFIGARSALSVPKTHTSVDAAPDAAGYLKLFGSALVLTLTNPMTVIAFAAIFMSAGIAVTPSVLGAVVATLGVALGSFAWWLVLVTGATLVRHGVGARTQLWLGRVSGALVALFGVITVVSVFPLT